ncbi:GTPase [Longispora sp. NPDC051575]|uniref:GTPase family protein n=1 Tax=Longispora sp. NPDC051575 TaxID=3154943 RepID=UPI003435C73F
MAGGTDWSDVIDDYRKGFPTDRKPCVLICGGTGVGKSTTINTLFGSQVSAVGHYERGTAQDQLYQWRASGENIDIVDLPGFGDSKQRDREYRDMYRRQVERAHGFIVITTPPRPASLPTLRTVKVLLDCGVPANRIVIGFNRLSMLNVEVDGVTQPVDISTTLGPASPQEQEAVQQARAAFLRDLRHGSGTPAFQLDQIIAYDALTGWNMFGLLDAVLANLPGDTIRSWQNAVSEAAAQAVERQNKRTAREQQRVADLEKQIAQLTRSNAALTGAMRDEVDRMRKQRKKLKKNKDDADKGNRVITGDGERHEAKAKNRVADFLDRNGFKKSADVVRSATAKLKQIFSW